LAPPQKPWKSAKFAARARKLGEVERARVVKAHVDKAHVDAAEALVGGGDSPFDFIDRSHVADDREPLTARPLDRLDGGVDRARQPWIGTVARSSFQPVGSANPHGRSGPNRS
jgi:hypothetical protein